MKLINKVLFSVFLVAVISCLRSVQKPDVTADELLNEIKYLSSDSLKGRMTGSPGDSLAADYIKRELKKYGLIPLAGDGLQRFKVTDKVVAGKDNSLSVNGKDCSPEKDFIPMSFSENGSLEAEVVFAGYGFNINNDSVKWNDYNVLNVKGKWIMILRADPEPDNSRSKFVTFSGDRDKALLAKDLGAAGILLVSGQLIDKEDIFEALNKGEFSVGIPVFRIRRTVADAILSKSQTRINDLENKLNSGRQPNSFLTGTIVKAKSEIFNYKVNTRNVVMLLPGEDTKLKNEYMIFGAHFDHLGLGGRGSPSRAPDTLAVHHGADDNASGVAMLMELAGRFAGTKKSHKRSLVFIAFTGEEEGLLGSKYFTDNPGMDLTKADAMVNMDMVGRLKDTKDLQVGGIGTAEGLREKTIALCDTNLLKLTFTEEGSGPSDHSSFYAKNIPVLFFTTGVDANDYHTPSDTWDKINYKGMVVVSDLVFKLSSSLACDSAKLHFKEAGPKSEVTRGYRKRGVTLGIMPDFAGIVKNGLRADLVTPGKPAALGGMKKGDIITSIETKPVNNIEDYMYRLNQLKKGQRISVEILRNGKKEVLIIQL
jgi:hypothetical protein